MTLFYLAPLAALSLVPGAFLLGRRFRPLPRRAILTVTAIAVVPLLASGALHLLRPTAFLPLIPPPFPRAKWLIVSTGIPELLGAVGLLLPATRKPASACLAVFLIAIFPANIHVAGQTIAGLPMPSVPVRTAMQAVYMLLVLISGWGVPTFSTFDTAQRGSHP